MKKYLWFFSLTIMLATSAGCGMEQVDTGFVGLETRFGKLVGEPLEPGLHFYNPVTSSISEIEVREQKIEEQEQAFTKDTQNVAVSYAVTFYPDPAKIHGIYTKYGRHWQEKAVAPAVKSSLKDSIGKYIADELVQNRDQAQKAALAELKGSLAEKSVIVTDFNFTNLDFDKAYEAAVEAKVVAIQEAAQAKNQTVQVEEQAKQTVLAAKADAESMRIKTQALAQNKGLVEYEAIQKWDGKLPEIMMGNSVPIINLDALKKAR
jgi:regulator of protease activity HflC (stomatin/prohibitin superfamily)